MLKLRSSSLLFNEINKESTPIEVDIKINRFDHAHSLVQELVNTRSGAFITIGMAWTPDIAISPIVTHQKTKAGNGNEMICC